MKNKISRMKSEKQKTKYEKMIMKMKDEKQKMETEK